VAFCRNLKKKDIKERKAVKNLNKKRRVKLCLCSSYGNERKLNFFCRKKNPNFSQEMNEGESDLTASTGVMDR